VDAGGSCGEPSAKTSTLYKDQNHVAGMVRIAEQAGNIRRTARHIRQARCPFAANVPTRIVESTFMLVAVPSCTTASRAAVQSLGSRSGE